MRVVIDSNVYVSALLFGGVPRVALGMCQSGLVDLVLCPAIRAEVEEVLTRKFKWSSAQVRSAGEGLWRGAVITVPRITLDDCADVDDNRILECAVASGSAFIVTGDRLLLALDPYREVRIVTPRKFLSALV